jgi:two-component system, OmpR family, response regulator
MTVTAVRHLTPVPTAAAIDAPGPRLTITVQISVTGTAPAEVARVLRDIQALAEQVSNATVILTPVPSSTVEAEPPVGLWIDPASRVVLRDGRSVRLTRREFDLLLFLCEHPRQVFSRDHLLSHVWGYGWVGGSRTVDVHVRRLRVKLGGPVVRTVHGVGYRLDEGLEVRIGQLPE